MTTEELTQQALALPLAKRLELAKTLLQSVDEDDMNLDADEQAMIVEAHRRAAEMAANPSMGRTHVQVFDAARRALK
jgi:putative addiction module component (TIGR02574 family)